MELPMSDKIVPLPQNAEYRSLYPGLGQAVAERTILRKGVDGVLENWGEVAHRVALGNSLLCRDLQEQAKEYQLLRKHIANGTTLMSGRHLQHGDETQPTRTADVFVNCATSATSFSAFLLLLSGAGVGRSYDDDMMLVDWNNMPNLRVVLSHTHGDFDWSANESVRDALHKYGPHSKHVMWFEVPDTREGWAQALEVLEVAAFEKIHKDKMLILDFSNVRPKGSPIAGMQGRPASGPIPLMNAFMKIASIKGVGYEPWRQAMYVDHYAAECVLVGGARRAARMSTKFWKDKNVVDFIGVKRPIEFEGKSLDEIVEYRRDNPPAFGFLWSSNNSVTVDEEFWKLVDLKRTDDAYNSEIAKHARKVWNELTKCAFADGTGEPGIINVDKLVRNDEGWNEMIGDGNFIGSKKYHIREETELYLKRLAKRAKAKRYPMIVNPCSEVALSLLSGFCVIADVVPFHANDLSDAEEAFRTVTRALIRVNTMDSIYHREVKRTNRIGVGMTGVHEFAWKFFGVGFRDLIDPDFDGFGQVCVETFEDEGKTVSEVISDVTKRVLAGEKSGLSDRQMAAAFWHTLEKFNAAVNEEAEEYSKKLGMTIPHTITVIKPAGSVSKLFGLTEGWHLPSMKFYMRWVQFRHDDPLIEVHRANGYPVKELKTYSGTTIVGFPTAPTLSTIMPEDRLVTAAEATPEEQYEWLRLGERYWIRGYGDVDRGNQISFTLHYDAKIVDHKTFKDTLRKHQRTVKCCSVMPKGDSSSYEYLPEEMISKAEYEAVAQAIVNSGVTEDVGFEHVDCSTGACPISWKDDAASA